uniref:Endoplasmic reticulum-Golgi intermediate compartment protein 3 n=1 Tax=Anopheles coluzzii TaxID=1518534 RepID=A0A8W7P7C7_ANOCL
MRFLDSLRRLDAYPKIDNEFSIRTVSGAALTLISSIVIVTLVIGEINAYLSPNVSEELFGNQIEEPKKEDIQASTKRISSTEAPATTTVKPACGSCYGAAKNASQCCNTCQEVIDAYRERKWNPNVEDFEQCKNGNGGSVEGKAFSEGCHIYGTMEVNRVEGRFHIAPGKSFSINHIHVHDVQPYSSSRFNTTHRINTLSFGEQFGFGTTRPLDGLMVEATEAHLFLHGEGVLAHVLQIIIHSRLEIPQILLEDEWIFGQKLAQAFGRHANVRQEADVIPHVSIKVQPEHKLCDAFALLELVQLHAERDELLQGGRFVDIGRKVKGGSGVGENLQRHRICHRFEHGLSLFAQDLMKLVLQIILVPLQRIVLRSYRHCGHLCAQLTRQGRS